MRQNTKFPTKVPSDGRSASSPRATFRTPLGDQPKLLKIHTISLKENHDTRRSGKQKISFR